LADARDCARAVISKVPIAGLSIKEGRRLPPALGRPQAVSPFAAAAIRACSIPSFRPTEMRLAAKKSSAAPIMFALMPDRAVQRAVRFSARLTINRPGFSSSSFPSTSSSSFLRRSRRPSGSTGWKAMANRRFTPGFPSWPSGLRAARQGLSDHQRIAAGVGRRSAGNHARSINSRSNAATAETHRRVMKLKNFERHHQRDPRHLAATRPPRARRAAEPADLHLDGRHQPQCA